MGRFIASLLSSIDGFDANEEFIPTGEEHQVFNDLLARVEGVVFDRDSYALLVPAWDVLDLDDPGVGPEEREFAEIFRTKRRYVVDESLGQVDPLATLVDGDPIPPLRALRESGGDMMIAGGVGLLDILFDHDLIDEVENLMLPVVMGDGNRQIGALSRTQRLDLIDVRALPSGAVALRYRVVPPEN